MTHQTDGSQDLGVYGYNSHTDVETVTGEDGNIDATYGYTAYGKNDESEFTGIDKPDATNPNKEEYNPYRFNAKRFDTASGTYDMGFRDYSPDLNRFTTRDMYNGALADMNLGTDPITGNRYSYGGGNPTTLIELDGHGVAECMSGVITGCSGGIPDEDSVYHADRVNSCGNERACGEASANDTRDVMDQALSGEDALATLVDTAQGIVFGDLANSENAEALYSVLSEFTGGSMTAGLCVGGDIAKIIGVDISSCVVVTKRADGSFSLARNESVGVELGSVGVGVQVNVLASNADDPSQLEGRGLDFEAGYAWGEGVNIAVEKGIGAETTGGVPVYAVTGGLSIGAEWESSIGVNYTGGPGTVENFLTKITSDPMKKMATFGP
ncbi:RHS repeat-associated core domain-containing protein [Streptomyces sp. MAR4 CNY-716]